MRWRASADELTATALLLLLVWALLRVELLLQALLTLVDAPGYQPAGVAWIVWGLAVLASALILAGGVRAGGMRPSRAWADLGVAVLGIFVLTHLCPPGLGADMPLLWMLPFGQGSVVALAMARIRPIVGAAGTVVIISSYLTAVNLHLSAGDVPATAVTNAVSFALFYAAAAAAVSIAWRLASRAREQRLINLAQQRELAALSERGRQFRVIHDSVLQSLEALSHRYITDPAQIQQVASAEAARLRAMLAAAGGNSEPGGLLSDLHWVAGQFPHLAVEIVDIDMIAGPPPDGAEPVHASAISAMTDAVRELLNNVTKHAGCPQATVSVSTPSEGALEVVVRDHGIGFDPSQVIHGFGLRESVIARMSEAGGQVQIWSQPDAGTRVTLTIPAVAIAGCVGIATDGDAAILPCPPVAPPRR